MTFLAAAALLSAISAAAPDLLPAHPALPAADSAFLAANPAARAEWWYYTGHLSSSGGDFGFELTFFRARLDDGDDVDAAHFAVTDVAGRRFLYSEKIHRPFPGIAETDAGKLRVRIENWETREEAGTQLLHAAIPGAELTLALTPELPPVLHGENGISRKGPRPDEYSTYLSIPRMRATGTLVRDGRPRPVTGEAWFDHEFGPGGLPADLAGWDWFGVQLGDGSALMIYRLRTKNGGVSPFSHGTLVVPGRPPVGLGAADFEIAATGSWSSPRSGAVYPSGWRLRVPARGIDLTVAPRLRDQELVTSRSTRVTYWEGACAVSGTSGGRPVAGKSYVELTGYAGGGLP